MTKTADRASTAPTTVPPPERMLQLITGYWISQAIHCVTKLGVPDKLGEGEKSAAELARECGVHEEALYRVLRALTSSGVLVEKPGRTFVLTEVGAMLRTGVAGSMKNFALMIVDDYNWSAWGELAHSVRTGDDAAQKVFGSPLFDYLAEQPNKLKTFGESMSDLSNVETPAVASAYDFSRFTKLVDVGGSHGALLAAILKRNPKLAGVVYDSPHVIENAKRDVHVGAREIAGRIETQSGNFFESVPAGADAYMMKYILHDWDDEKASRILSNVKRAMRPNGTLLVIDTVVPAGPENWWSKWLDINMLVLVGGKERTEAQFRALFERAGFRLTRVVPTGSALSILEGVPA